MKTNLRLRYISFTTNLLNTAELIIETHKNNKRNPIAISTRNRKHLRRPKEFITVTERKMSHLQSKLPERDTHGYVCRFGHDIRGHEGRIHALIVARGFALGIGD
ncbi:hypothetical protein TNCT_126081 [Trichonephila clavata]|uniref:Uncharacterized protein n=1 Tax=Trichonephila clavata TaxID=2740835 RepID=A0A8X6I151_TRICU|nr:hypothetical protein TNCT_126081 [Trichonephila clavata]